MAKTDFPEMITAKLPRAAIPIQGVRAWIYERAQGHDTPDPRAPSRPPRLPPHVAVSAGSGPRCVPVADLRPGALGCRRRSPLCLPAVPQGVGEPWVHPLQCEDQIALGRERLLSLAVLFIGRAGPVSVSALAPATARRPIPARPHPQPSPPPPGGATSAAAPAPKLGLEADPPPSGASGTAGPIGRDTPPPRDSARRRPQPRQRRGAAARIRGQRGPGVAESPALSRLARCCWPALHLACSPQATGGST